MLTLLKVARELGAEGNPAQRFRISLAGFPLPVFQLSGSFKKQERHMQRNILENTPLPALMVDPDGTIRSANEDFCLQFGFEKNDLDRTPLHEVLPALTASKLFGESPPQDQIRQFHKETHLNTRYGEKRWVRVSCDRIVEGFHGAHLVIHIIDITDLKKRITLLGSEYARMKGALDTSTDAILILDAHGRVIKHNRAALTLFGMHGFEILGMDVMRLFEVGESDRHGDAATLLGDGTPRSLSARQNGGGVIPVRVVRRTKGSREEPFHIVMVQRADNGEPSSESFLEVEDSVRTEIGQDLHDTLGGILSGIGMLGGTLLKRVKQVDEGIHEELDHLLSLIREADEYTHLLAHGMIRTYVHRLGFHEAMRRHCERTQRLFSVRCEYVTSVSRDESRNGQANGHDGQENGAVFHADDQRREGASRGHRGDEPQPIPIEKESAYHLYSISQEAIHNAIRHGGATFIRVMLSRIGPVNVLAIEDNGCGPSAAPSEIPRESGGGMGLEIMRLRARRLGGELSLNRTRSGSTVLECRFPAMHRHSASHIPFVQEAY